MPTRRRGAKHALAMVFSKLSSLVPKVGGPYAYSRIGFGDFAGGAMLDQ
jgi:amino acid transporter